MTPAPRESNDVPHSQSPTVFLCRRVNTACGALSREQFPVARLTDRPSTLVEPPLKFRQRGISADVVSSSVALRRGFSCTEPYQEGPLVPPKSTDQIVRQPTKWSKMFSRALFGICGARVRRQNSQQSSIAIPGPSNATCKAPENGPATRSPPSFPKFSNDIRCATSG